MFLTNGWDVFCAHSKTNDIGTDQISIDGRNKRYILDIDIVRYMPEEYDSDYDEDESIPRYTTYLSRLVFDIILNGLKEKGFKELIIKNN